MPTLDRVSRVLTAGDHPVMRDRLRAPSSLLPGVDGVEAVFISDDTLNSRRKNILVKFGACDRIHAATIANRPGLLIT